GRQGRSGSLLHPVHLDVLRCQWAADLLHGGHHGPGPVTAGSLGSPVSCRDARSVGDRTRLDGMARIVTDQKTRVVGAPVAVIVAIVTAGYMLPWAIAAVRGTRNAWTVFWVNLLLGWTIVGWIIALVMSIREHRILDIR